MIVVFSYFLGTVLLGCFRRFFFGELSRKKNVSTCKKNKGINKLVFGHIFFDAHYTKPTVIQAGYIMCLIKPETNFYHGSIF